MAGGWPEGREHIIFRLGFTALAAQLLVLVFGRLGLLHRAARMEVRGDLLCPMDCCRGECQSSEALKPTWLCSWALGRHT